MHRLSTHCTKLHETARACPRFLLACVRRARSCAKQYYRHPVIAAHLCGICIAEEDGRKKEDCPVASRQIAVDIDDVYVLPQVDGAGSIPDEWQSSATYTLEMAVRCPHCDEAIHTIRIVGMSRSQVAFTSTLPRKGRVAICPECDRILPVELSGML
jgi:hypothetical protein